MTIEEWTLSITAGVATLTFVFSVWQQQKRTKEAELRAWQAVALQSFFEKRGRDSADIGEVLQWYRTEATAYLPGVSKTELSENACRRIVLELVDKSIVEQVEDAKYRLNRADTARDMVSDMMKPMLESMTPFMGEQKLVKGIYSVVAAAPFQKTTEAVIVAASENTGEPVESLRTLLAQEVARQRLQINDENKIGFGPMAIGGN